MYNNEVPKYMKEKLTKFNKKQIIQQLLWKTSISHSKSPVEERKLVKIQKI